MYCACLSGQNIATVSGTSVTINNGAIETFIRGGRMERLSLVGGVNLLENGGYGYFSYVDNEGFYSPSFLNAEVAVNTEDIADIYFEHANNFIVEMHYVFKKGESGFYTYCIVSDNNLGFKVLGELRWAVRVDKDIFDYAWTIEREGPMIHPDELVNAVDEIQDATYELTDGSIYSKYDWAVDMRLDSLHGLLGNGYGIWNIEPSSEYINGGPTMQDLTVHGTTTTPILLSTIQTSHYGNIDIALKDEYLEWNKVWGPAFTYINTGANDVLIEDAKQKASEKTAEWPYDWLLHELYPLDRGTLSGSLNMLGSGEVDSAMVVLSKPPPSWRRSDEDWQRQPYDYIFWDEVDAAGNFQIKDVRPGTYTLYAYTQKGKLIDQLKIENITVTTGQTDLGALEWGANDRDRVLFQIGQADHRSSEFGLGDLPRLYGRWNDTPDNLDYEVGTSNDRDDWYYCQRENTAWNVHFDVTNKDSLSDAVLKVALAGADASPHLDAILNGEKIGYVRAGTDSGIRRSSLSAGKYAAVSFPFDKNLLVNGRNTLTLSCFGSPSEYKGLMYDAVLMEANVGTPTVSSNEQQSIDRHYTAYGSQRSINVQSAAQEEGLISIYTIGTGQLVYRGTITPGPNTININRSGQFVIMISDNNKMYRKKIFLF